jgi:hypothetical protein
MANVPAFSGFLASCKSRAKSLKECKPVGGIAVRECAQDGPVES